MAIQEFTPDFVPGARIKVFGVGGGGCNTITRMVQDRLEGVEFVAVNTDAQALTNNPANQKLQHQHRSGRLVWVFYFRHTAKLQVIP
mgnify:CR=1 FL=1